MTTAVLTSIWNYFWGDSEKTQLLSHLLAKGIPEQDAALAVKLCPRISLQNGQRILLLQSMLNQQASEMEAVKALLKAKGDTNKTIEIYNEAMKRQSILNEFVDMGIPNSVAKEALEACNWDKKKARHSLEIQKKREMKKAKREYQAHKQVVQKLAAASHKKPKVHQANHSSKKVKHSRYRSSRSKKKEAMIELCDDSDDESKDHSISDSAMEEEEEEEPMQEDAYHSSDDSEKEDTKPSESTRKSTATSPVRSTPVVTRNSPARSTTTTTPQRKMAPVVSTAHKKRVFALRKQISVSTCKSLSKALKSLDPNDIVAGLNNLKKKADFRTGAAAGYLDVLTKFPGLRESVIKTLDEKATNRS